jgi:hypothetical protein
VPFRRQEDSGRKSTLWSALHQWIEQLRELAAAKPRKSADEEALECRCRRVVYPDGRIYWSFTWPGSGQEANPVQRLATRYEGNNILGKTID